VNIPVSFNGPPNGPILFCWLASVVVVCRRRQSSSVTLPAGGSAGRRERGNAAWENCRRSGGRPPGAWAVERLTLHGGPVVLRHVRATPCIKLFKALWNISQKYKSKRAIPSCRTPSKIC